MQPSHKLETPICRTLLEEIAAALEDGTLGGLPENPDDLVESINHAGVLMHRALATGADYQHELRFLKESIARAANRDRSVRRIAAQVALWPHYSAIYYGFLSQPVKKRLEARNELLEIQRSLYSDLRTTLEWISLSLGPGVSKAAERLKTRSARAAWRPPVLLGPGDSASKKAAPVDLCAIDCLLLELIQLDAAEPNIRVAIRNIHQQSVSEGEEANKAKACKHAFQALHVAQLTVFFPDTPGSEISVGGVLNELVHVSKLDGDSLPDLLVPFDVLSHRGEWIEDPDRWPFRRLCHAIFSDPRDGTRFSEQRKLTLKAIGATRIFSAAHTTKEFLIHSADEPYKRLKLGLADLNGFSKEQALPDWSAAEWWTTSASQEDLLHALCPGDNFELFENHHLAVLWDLVVSKWRGERELPSTVTDLLDCLEEGSKDPSIGYLLDVLLRRHEKSTRTVIFFELARQQPLGPAKDSVVQFIGGTFVGLERPGIPFCEERFQELCDHLRPLVLALGHYTTNRAARRRVELRQKAEKEYSGRIQSVVDLLVGSKRGGLLLYCSIFDQPSNRRDHQPQFPTPSREEIVEIFRPHWAGRYLQWTTGMEDADRKCDHTWKALLSVSDDADEDTLEKFRDSTETCPARSTKIALCEKCVRGAFLYFLGEEWSSRIEFRNAALPQFLPSRPGIRFVVALSNFMRALQHQTPAKIKKLELDRGRATIRFEDFPEKVRRALIKINMSGRSDPEKRGGGLPPLLESLRSMALSWQKGPDNWLQFLDSPYFATPLQISIKDERIDLRWPAYD